MELLEKEQITPDTLGLLMFIKLNTSPTDYVQKIIKEYVFDFKMPDSPYSLAEIFEKKGWITYIKTGKKDPLHRIRLSDKGEDILKALTQKPLNQLSDECWSILEEAYKMYDMDSKKIINKTKTTYFISEFLYEKESLGKNYTGKMFKAIVYDYLNSIRYDEKHFVKKTLNLLFDPQNKWASKWNKEDCPLWSWSEQNSERIKEVYRKLT
jgi:hypothetical protein